MCRPRARSLALGIIGDRRQIDLAVIAALGHLPCGRDLGRLAKKSTITIAVEIEHCITSWDRRWFGVLNRLGTGEKILLH